MDLKSRYTTGRPILSSNICVIAFILVLQKVHVGLQVKMYADDLIVYLSCSAEEANDIVASIVHCLREFGVYTGLRMDVGKSTIVLKGLDVQADMERLGLSVSSKVRCLGIIVGDVTPQEVYAKAIAFCFLRAQFLRDLDLTPGEKVNVLNIWILPL